MSELIAEARVLVTPDTTTFRAQLVAQTTAAAKGVTVPVAVTPVITGTSATNAALASQLDDVALAQTKVSTTADGFAESQKRVAQTATVSTKQLANLSKGASSAGLAFLGLRGATLAAGGGFLAGAASLSLFAKSVQSAASLETSLNTFRVTADATATEMERISDVAKELGADLTLPGVTAGSAADALAGLARAGLSVEDSVDGVRGVLQLGTAAAIDNATAVTLVATALNSFSLNGDQAVRVADLLAASSKQSQGSIEDMGLALSQAAAAAAQAGISVEDTVAILTQLGRAGLRGSDAGTSFRTAILRIVNPSKEAKAAIEGLGVELRDLQGNIRPEVFSEIATQAAKLGPAQRDATIALIGGQDAFRAISILGRAGAEGLDQMRAATQEVGAASDLASARTEGLAGSAANLQNQFQTLGLTVGEAASGPLQGFVDSLANSVSGLNNFIGFLGRIGDETPRAEQSISDLADEFVRLNEEAGGGVTHEQAVQNIREIGKSAAIATLDYAELVKEAGRANAEVARGSEKGFVSRAAQNEVERLNDELREVQSEGVGARDVIEGLRAGLDAAAGAAAGLTARLDESFDRFATTLPEPTAPPVTRKRVSSLQGDISLAQSEGDLRETERLQEKALANAIEAEEKGIHKGVVARQKLFDERRAAEIALNNTRKQIAAQNAADARTTAAEVARRQKEADEAFLQGQEDARTRQERSISIAADTPGLKDDIREQKENRDLIDRQIAAIKASSLTEKQKQAAIRELTAERNRTTDAIRELKQTDAEQREAAKEQANEERIALGESIFDLTGNKQPLLKALNAEITRTQKEINAAKKAGKSTVVLQTELNKLLLQRKNLNEETKEGADKDAVGGTSLADLFTQAEDILSGAGNVGFNAQSLQGLSARPRIEMEVQQRLDIVNDPAAARAAKQQQSTDRLIAAIDQLTNAITGNSSTGTVRQGPQNRNRWRSLTEEQRFYYQRQAKQMVEQGLTG